MRKRERERERERERGGGGWQTHTGKQTNRQTDGQTGK